MGHAVAVLGASGYAGGELVRLVDGHPALDLVYLGGHASAGTSLSSVHPQLAGGDRPIGPLEGAVPDGVELAFLALPHGASADPGHRLAAGGIRVVDLGSDFRLSDPQVYREAYGSEHPRAEELGAWVYGLPELFGEAIAGADRVAAPGCYPTAAVLALAPLLREGLLEGDGIVVSAVSGVSGAGRSLRQELLFGEVAEGIRAYGLPAHRHRPEMEQALAEATGHRSRITFTPHLAPFQRGLLATCYGRLSGGADQAALVSALRDAYAGSPFVEVIEHPPQTRWTVGSNRCLLAAFSDPATGTAVVLSALDNLIKGAAGQAVQDANLMMGLDEAAGLPRAGWMP